MKSVRRVKTRPLQRFETITADGDAQASALTLAYGLTCFPAEPCGNGPMAYPEDALRDARVAATLLREVPQTSASDVEAVVALQVGSAR